MVRISRCVWRGMVLTAACVTGVAWAEEAVEEPLLPWNGAAVSDWDLVSEAKLITDMTQAEPKAFSDTLKPEHWKTIPYEMVPREDWVGAQAMSKFEPVPYDPATGTKGTMVYAPPEANAPPLEIGLNTEGWHAIFVGLFSASEASTSCWIRLDGDPGPVLRSNSLLDYYGSTSDVFFEAAKLTKDSKLHIIPQNTGAPASCGVTHIKLIPLSDEEIAFMERDRADGSKAVMAATDDGFSKLYHYSPRSAEMLLGHIELFRHTDFGTLILQSPGADKVTYPSEIGHRKGIHAEWYPRIGDRQFVEAVKELNAKGINPLETMIEEAQAKGKRVYVGVRPGGWSFYEPFSDYWESPFYWNHPEWRTFDRDGKPVTRMSWAVPEVRQHMISLLVEQVSFGADGAHLVFNRGFPVVLYEEPFVELFKEEHGVDPREIPESDPRIRRAWSDVVTTFFLELRAALDAEQQRQGRDEPLLLSAMVLGTEEDNLRYGVDVRRLVNEGLLDEVFMSAWGFGGRTREYDLDFFREVCEPKDVPFSPMKAGHWEFSKQLEQVLGFHEAGAKGPAAWDAWYSNPYQWAVESRLGHVKETKWRMENLDFSNPPRSDYFFHKLGDQIRDGRFGPFWGG